MIANTFWQGKKVLITGHTGFKGSWLSIWLHEMGADVIGYSLEPNSDRDNYVLSGISNRIIDIRGDIRDMISLNQIFEKYQPEIVFHLAAQPLVRLSYDEPYLTYETNVMGTLNVLRAIQNCNATKIGIMITTDKCYENMEQERGYTEEDRFGGYDPYSSSKACAEILISSFRNSYFNLNEYSKHGKAIASVRAGNVIGGGDWALDRLVPDCIRALEKDEQIKIRNPKSVRPFQHVLEPLAGYIMLAEKLYAEPLKYSGGWNFGPEKSDFATARDVAEKLIKYYGSGSLVDASDPDAVHEAKLLYLNIKKAKTYLGWKPVFNIDKTIEVTVDWYKRYMKEDVYNLCIREIENYMEAQIYE